MTIPEPARISRPRRQCTCGPRPCSTSCASAGLALDTLSMGMTRRPRGRDRAGSTWCGSAPPSSAAGQRSRRAGSSNAPVSASLRAAAMRLDVAAIGAQPLAATFHGHLLAACRCTVLVMTIFMRVGLGADEGDLAFAAGGRLGAGERPSSWCCRCGTAGWSCSRPAAPAFRCARPSPWSCRSSRSCRRRPPSPILTPCLAIISSIFLRCSGGMWPSACCICGHRPWSIWPPLLCILWVTSHRPGLRVWAPAADATSTSAAARRCCGFHRASSGERTRFCAAATARCDPALSRRMSDQASPAAPHAPSAAIELGGARGRQRRQEAALGLPEGRQLVGAAVDAAGQAGQTGRPQRRGLGHRRAAPPGCPAGRPGTASADR